MRKKVIKMFNNIDFDKEFKKYVIDSDKILGENEINEINNIENHVFSEEYIKRKNELIDSFENKKKPPKLRYIAACLAMFFSMNGFLYITVDAYSSKVNVIIANIYKTFTEVNIFNKSYNNTDLNIPKYVIDGFEIVDVQENENNIFITYLNQNNEIYTFTQSKIDNIVSYLDTENTNLENIIINDIVISYVENKDFIIAIWNDENVFYELNGEISYKNMVEFVENLQK